MRNKDNRDSLFRQGFDGFKQHLRFRFGKDGGRFIQHQQPYIIAIDFAGNFGKLLMSYRHLGNQRLRVDRNTELIERTLRPLAHCFPV